MTRVDDMIRGLGLGSSILGNLGWAIQQCDGSEDFIHHLSDRETIDGRKFLLKVGAVITDLSKGQRGEIRLVRTWGEKLSKIIAKIGTCMFTDGSAIDNIFSDSQDGLVPVTLLPGRYFTLDLNESLEKLAAKCYRPATAAELIGMCVGDQLNPGVTVSLERSNQTGQLLFVEDYGMGKHICLRFLDELTHILTAHSKRPELREHERGIWIPVVRDVEYGLSHLIKMGKK